MEQSDETHAAFQKLFDQKKDIEFELGEPLSWEDHEGRRVCRIAIYTKGSVDDGPDALGSYRAWFAEKLVKFDRIFGWRIGGSDRPGRPGANTGRDWDRDRKDSVAALWAYDQTYGGPISKLTGSVVANVALLIGRAVDGVYNKVLNFRYLDPRQGGKGLSGGGETDTQVWQEFFNSAASAIRSDALDDEFRRAWQSKPVDAPKQPVVYAEFGEAPNDDPAQLQAFVRKVRRGQLAFRRNLLAAYEGRCCISGWAPEAALEAAHIEEHSKAGLNSPGNGLLLRSDLHALFDEGLLRIDPERRVVVLAPELQETPYWELNGRPLRTPVQGEGLRRDLLLARWRMSDAK